MVAAEPGESKRRFKKIEMIDRLSMRWIAIRRDHVMCCCVFLAVLGFAEISAAGQSSYVETRFGPKSISSMKRLRSFRYSRRANRFESARYPPKDPSFPN